ncbi:MAG: DNA internalization-related competence protein ComEC/Rec2 [Oscillibacter sp.]
MRKLATFAFAFAAGVFLAQYALPHDWLLPLAAAIVAGSLLGLLRRGNFRGRVLLIGWGLSLACFWNWGYTQVVQAPAEAMADTDRYGVTMTLCDYAAPTDYGAKATVYMEGLRFGKAVYYGGEELLELTPGQTVTGDLHLQSAARIRDDDITNFTSKGIFLLAYQRSEVELSAGSADSPRWWPIRLGEAMRGQIDRLFTGDTAAFVTAILTGDKTNLSDAAAIGLSEAGLYHILAVSGMHCAFLLALVTALTGAHRRRLTAMLAIPILLFYMLLTGCTPSVVRACVMLIFLLAAPLFRRERDGPTAMAAALLLILLANPFAAASISLQLSFAAVAGLLWLTPRMSRFLMGQRRGRVLRFLAASLSASCGALVFTIPMTAYYFNIFVLVAPVANLLCLWAASIVFAVGMVAVLASFLWLPLGAVLGLVPRAFIWYILQVTQGLAHLPYHALYFSNPYLKYWLVYAYALFGGAYLWKPKARRKYAVAGVCVVLTLIGTVKLGALRTQNHALDFAVLDVGQGSCTLLSSGGEFALVDCGSGNSWYDAGEIAADQLASRGCGKLNQLILTHYDYDHISGVKRLLSRMEVERLLVPEETESPEVRDALLATARDCGTEVIFVTEKTAYSLGESDLHIYPPLGDGGDNEEGLTILCSAGDYDLLITGDMDSKTERKLLEQDGLPDIEALVAGHHGSRHSTSEELLEALKPECALISVGSNSYGHPADEALGRLVRAGVKIYRTDMQGTIHFTVN